MAKTDQKTVSVIVPMFHGKKYLDDILRQIEKCAQKAGDTEVELILYNDSPEEEICIYGTGYSYIIKVFNPGFNSGIHGARVHALENAAGDYVLFLDQDDVIRDDYIEKQCSTIGDADAVVCRVIHGKKLHYTNSFRFEHVITKEFMLHQWCPIISPGQVLIRREAIPDVWKKHILTNNGADDYFLWLCMMAEGKKFALNQEILFEHISTGANTSENTNMMMDSEEEMLQILKRKTVFKGEDAEALDRLKLSLRKIHIKQLDTQRRALNCLNFIYQSFVNMKCAYDWINSHNDKRIAIYGAGELGVGLCDFLKGQGIVPLCYLDRNAEFILSDIPSYTMEDAEIELDSILLTIQDRILREKLKEKFHCEVIDIADVNDYGLG